MTWSRVQLGVSVGLVFATGCVVGVTKLSQVLMTTADGPYATESESAAERFLVTFGFSKACFNVLAGTLADTVGRKPVMVLGWLAGVLFCATMLCARSWMAVVACDILLGANQALCWSAALFIAQDILGHTRRALASGLIETFGYAAIALASPLVSALGPSAAAPLHSALLVLCLGSMFGSLLALRESNPNARLPAASRVGRQWFGHSTRRRTSTEPVVGPHASIVWPSGRSEGVSACHLACVHASCLDHGLMACCLVGLVLNLTTAFAWGFMSRWLSALGPRGDATGLTELASGSTAGVGGRGGDMSVGVVLLLYSIPKGLCQLPAGALADRRLCGAGPRSFVIAGLGLCAAALGAFALLTSSDWQPSTVVQLAAPLACALGLSTALAYTPVLACVASRADPDWRASALGAYRFWRDAGYAVGGMLLGSIADASATRPWATPLVATLALVLTAGLFFATFEEPTPPPGGMAASHTRGFDSSRSARSEMRRPEVEAADCKRNASASPACDARVTLTAGLGAASDAPEQR